MKLSKFILGSSLVLVTELAFAYNWPFANPNEQVAIRGVLGEFRPPSGGTFTHFHKGVDLIKGVDTPVYSPDEGKVAYPPGGQSLYVVIPPTNRYGYGYGYWHIKDHTGLDVVPGKEVYPIGHPKCKPIGKVREQDHPHLHFEDVLHEVNESGTPTDISCWLDPLAPGRLGATSTSGGYGFKDYINPRINWIRYCENRTEDSINGDWLYGKVDISVRAYDPRIGDDGFEDAGGGMGVKRVTCNIYETWMIKYIYPLFWEDYIKRKISLEQLIAILQSRAFHFTKVYLNEIRFENIPKYSSNLTESNRIERNKGNLTFRSGSTAARPDYWVTNLPDITNPATQTNFYWNTIGLLEDSYYIVEIEVEDFHRNTTRMYDLVKVDNHAPYLEMVQVHQENSFFISKGESEVKSLFLERLSSKKLYSNSEIQKINKSLNDELYGYKQRYSAYWKENTNDNNRTLNILDNKPLIRGIKTKFSLYFSQPIQEDYLSAFIYPKYNANKRIEIKLYPMKDDMYGKIFISEPVTIPSTADFDGELLFNVHARDLTYNGLDSNPTTIAVKSEEHFGFHVGYEEGLDMNHSFELPRVPTAPSNFTATVIRQNQQPLCVNFSWQGNPQDGDGYEIFYRKDGEKDYILDVEIHSPKVNSIEGIVPPERGVYFYKVMAFKKESGYSLPSAEAMVSFVPGGEDTDMIPPGGRIIFEREGYYVKGSVTIKAKVWDNIGVKKVEFYCSGASGEEYFIGESSNFYHKDGGTFTIYEWDSSKLGRAGYGIYCYIRDYAGNRGLSENTWLICTDNIPPIGISNLQTFPDRWTNINYFGAWWDASQDYESYVEGYYYSLNSPPTENSSFTLYANTDALFLPKNTPSGVYPVYIAPKDAAGNIGPISRGLFFYDISLPIVSDCQSTPALVFASETVKFTARVEDIHSGVREVGISTSVFGIDMLMNDDGTDGDKIANDGIYTTQVTIPKDTRRGIYNLVITASDNSDNLTTATITLQIGLNSKITISPTSGTVGTMITIKGENYLANEQVRIDFGKTLTIGITTTDAEGKFTATFKIDLQKYGTKTITATGLVSNLIVTNMFNILDDTPPIITNLKSTPEIIEVGKSVKLTLNAEDEISDIKSVTINLTSIGGSANQPMDDNGTNGDEKANDNIYTYVTLIPSKVSCGKKDLIVTARDIAENIATGTIIIRIIAPKLTSILPTSGTIGTEVTIKGEGYLASEQIRIDFGTTRSIVITKTNSVGSFTANFTVNSQPYGLTTITAGGLLSNGVVNAIFNIKPVPCAISGKVTIIETGEPIKGVKIEALQQNIVIGSATTSKDGTYTISDLPPGNYDITASINNTYQTQKGIIVNSNKETSNINFAFNKYLYKEDATRIYTTSRHKTNRVFYLYPSDPDYKIYNWSYRVYRAKRAYDNGTFIDYAQNRLVIKVRLNGKWYRKAKYNADYIIYTKKSLIPDTKSDKLVQIPVKIVEEKIPTTKSNSMIMLMKDSTVRSLGANNLEEKPKIAIMIKDVEEELTTVKLKLSFNPNKMKVEDVGTPTFEDSTIKLHLQKNIIDNQNGKIDIKVVIVDEDDGREEKGTVSDKILSNSQSRSILENEEKEEENIAPIAYLIIDIPQQYKPISYQRGLEEIMSGLIIDEVELKDAEGNIIEVKIDDRNITKIQPEANLDKAYCYPNPTNKGEITFAKLTERVKVRIFNIAGELVYVYEGKTEMDGTWTWKCINNAGEKVASGIYIYILKDPVSGSMKRGKLGVIR